MCVCVGLFQELMVLRMRQADTSVDSTSSHILTEQVKIFAVEVRDACTHTDSLIIRLD